MKSKIDKKILKYLMCHHRLYDHIILINNRTDPNAYYVEIDKVNFIHILAFHYEQYS